MGHLWLTDCDSLYEHLATPKENAVDSKRLQIDLQALRQDIWERDTEIKEEIDSKCGDYPRWIDISAMIVDPMTKVMKSDRLTEMLKTGVYDWRPTSESMAIKEAKKAYRRNKKENEAKEMDGIGEQNEE